MNFGTMNVFGLSFTFYVVKLLAGTEFYKYTNQQPVRTQLLWLQFISDLVISLAYNSIFNSIFISKVFNFKN